MQFLELVKTKVGKYKWAVTSSTWLFNLSFIMSDFYSLFSLLDIHTMVLSDASLSLIHQSILFQIIMELGTSFAIAHG